MNIDKLKKKINNTGFKVKISLRKLREDKYSIYLDYHYMVGGKEQRERKTLGFSITGLLKNYPYEKNLIQEAMIIRNRYEEIVRRKRHNIFEQGENLYLYSWMERFKNKQTKLNSMKAWKSMIRHLKKFQRRDILLKDITRKFCEDFAHYLLTCKDINQNSAHTYFTRFKIAIKRAYEESIISRNFTDNIIIKKTEGKREYLTIEELTKIYKTPYKRERIKRAFIFSCFTGLRLSDIIKLQFTDIVSERGHLFIAFFDKKTEEYNKNILHPTAEQIYNIEMEDHPEGDQVFVLPCGTAIRHHVKKMVKAAGIDKHITPHCGRHTFATLSINNGMDLYTLSKYLGHNDVKVTQIYAKLIDKKKDDAIFKIPVI